MAIRPIESGGECGAQAEREAHAQAACGEVNPLVHFLSTWPWHTEPIDLKPSRSSSVSTFRSLRIE